MILEHNPKIILSSQGVAIVTKHGSIPFGNYEDTERFLSEVKVCVTQRGGYDLPFVFVPEFQGDQYRVMVRSVANGKVVGGVIDFRYDTLSAASQVASEAYNDWFSNPEKYGISLESLDECQLTVHSDGKDYSLRISVVNIPVIFTDSESYDICANKTEARIYWRLFDGEKLVGNGAIQEGGVIQDACIVDQYHGKGLYTLVLSVLNNFSPLLSRHYDKGDFCPDVVGAYRSLEKNGEARDEWDVSKYYQFSREKLKSKALFACVNIFKKQ